MIKPKPHWSKKTVITCPRCNEKFSAGREHKCPMALAADALKFVPAERK